MLERQPRNQALDDTNAADLNPQYPSRVKQNENRDARQGQARRAEIYAGTDPADERRANAAPRQTVRATGNDYELNFDSANIADVAKAILGDTLRQPYILDPRVQGQLTLSTGRPVSRDELLKAFESALKLSNATLVADGSGFRIVPAGEAAAGESGRVSRVRAGDPVPAGFGVSVLPLRHTSAEAMLRLLDGYLARAGSVRAESTGNLLLIRGGGRERENIIDVAATFDVDWMKGQSAGIFPLQHAAPDELIAELNQVMQTEGATLNANMVRFQPLPRLNAILALARRADHLKTAAEWVKRLDRTNAAGQTVHVYQVENGKAVDIAGLLNDMFGAGGGSSGGGSRRSARAEVSPNRDAGTLRLQGGDASGARQQGQAQQSGQAAQQQPAQGGAQAGMVPQPRAIASAAASTGSGASLDVRIVPDEQNNTLLISANQADYAKILTALRQIDKPPLQVLINATIAEVTLNDNLRYGVQAFLDVRGRTTGSIGYHDGPGLTLKPKVPGLNLLLGNTIADPRLILDALSDVTSVKVVSSPSLVVVDNQSATLKVGDEVPVSTQQVQNTGDSNAPIINSIRFRETGVILKVTPRVNSSGLVTMEIEQEISQVANNADGSTTSSLTPTISQRRIASTIAVYSNQTVALGGLISEQTNRDRKSIPLINRIPIIGEALGSTSNTAKRTELIVFIKPQVIRNSEDASKVSSELRDKLKAMTFETQQNPRHDERRVEQPVGRTGTKDPIVRR